MSGDCTKPVQNNIDQSMLWDSVHIYTFTSVSSNSRCIYWSQLYFFPLFPGSLLSLNYKNKKKSIIIILKIMNIIYIYWCQKCPQLGGRCLLLDTVILRYLYQLFNRTVNLVFIFIAVTIIPNWHYDNVIFIHTFKASVC